MEIPPVDGIGGVVVVDGGGGGGLLSFVAERDQGSFNFPIGQCGGRV